MMQDIIHLPRPLPAVCTRDHELSNATCVLLSARSGTMKGVRKFSAVRSK